MAEESMLRGAIVFLDKIGVYDILLPFLLVFTIFFAILEKTKVLGVEKINGQDYSKKNLNSMVAFVVGFLVIASTKIVAVINEVMANVILMIILSICFIMLVGTFYKDEEFSLFEKHPGWVRFFVVLAFIGIVLIFMNALDWLKPVVGYFGGTGKDIFYAILFAVGIFFILKFIIGKDDTKK